MDTAQVVVVETKILSTEVKVQEVVDPFQCPHRPFSMPPVTEKHRKGAEGGGGDGRVGGDMAGAEGGQN